MPIKVTLLVSSLVISSAQYIDWHWIWGLSNSGIAAKTVWKYFQLSLPKPKHLINTCYIFYNLYTVVFFITVFFCLVFFCLTLIDD